LEKIIKIDPKHVEAIVLLGKILIMLGRYKEASFYLWKAHEIQPDHSEVINFVAIMKTKMQECLKLSHQNILKNKIDHAMLWILKGILNIIKGFLYIQIILNVFFLGVLCIGNSVNMQKP
jgi:hypothetical protein